MEPRIGWEKLMIKALFVAKLVQEHNVNPIFVKYCHKQHITPLFASFWFQGS